MARMTPGRPPQRRRLTSPLNEMDDDTSENLVPETPHEHSLDPAPLTGAMLADIVRSEIHEGLVPLQTQMANLNTRVCGHDVKIMTLE